MLKKRVMCDYIDTNDQNGNSSVQFIMIIYHSDNKLKMIL